jgi:hypothetical protein
MSWWHIILAPAAVLCAVVFTWGYYLSVMHLKSARDEGRLTVAAKALGYPWLAVGYVVDVIFNAIVGSILFLEPPRELLFTSRVSRLNDRPGWRGALARWVCANLLDPFDPDGHHCR